MTCLIMTTSTDIKDDFVKTLEMILQHDISQELYGKILFKLKLLKNEDSTGRKKRDNSDKV